MTLEPFDTLIYPPELGATRDNQAMPSMPLGEARPVRADLTSLCTSAGCTIADVAMLAAP